MKTKFVMCMGSLKKKFKLLLIVTMNSSTTARNLILFCFFAWSHIGSKQFPMRRFPGFFQTFLFLPFNLHIHNQAAAKHQRKDNWWCCSFKFIFKDSMSVECPKHQQQEDDISYLFYYTCNDLNKKKIA